jgi:hypothetical protein
MWKRKVIEDANGESGEEKSRVAGRGREGL